MNEQPRLPALAAGLLNERLHVYWDEFDRCAKGKAYWALLHIAVCMPDICAALESPLGETGPDRYRTWCKRYLDSSMLNPDERYRMRCIVLHLGRAATGAVANERYDGFSFGQPGPAGQIDHMRLDNRTLNVDVGALAVEIKRGVAKWIAALESDPDGQKALYVVRNLASLVDVRSREVPATTTPFPMASALPPSGSLPLLGSPQSQLGSIPQPGTTSFTTLKSS